MICPYCNAIVSDSQAFCGNCGARLEPSQPSRSPQYAQPETPSAPDGYTTQSGYAPSPYDQQPYGQYPNQPGSPLQQSVSNTPFGLAIAALVCAVIGLFPVAVVLAIIALVMNSNQKKAGIYTSKQGPTKIMGILGIIISALWLIAIVLFSAVLVTAVENGALDDLDIKTSPSGSSVTITTPSGPSINLNSDGSISTSSPTEDASDATSADNPDSSPIQAYLYVCGKWELESGTYENLDEESLNTIRDLGYNIELVVANEGTENQGTFELSLIDRTLSGTWSYLEMSEDSGIRTFKYLFTTDDGNLMATYEPEGDRLIWEDGTNQLVFRYLG